MEIGHRLTPPPIFFDAGRSVSFRGVPQRSALIVHAGVVIAINDDGEADAALGVVRQCDEKTFKDIRNWLERAETGEDTLVVDDAGAYPKSASVGGGLPKPVIRERQVFLRRRSSKIESRCLHLSHRWQNCGHLASFTVRGHTAEAKTSNSVQGAGPRNQMQSVYDRSTPRLRTVGPNITYGVTGAQTCDSSFKLGDARKSWSRTKVSFGSGLGEATQQKVQVAA